MDQMGQLAVTGDQKDRLDPRGPRGPKEHLDYSWILGVLKYQRDYLRILGVQKVVDSQGAQTLLKPLRGKILDFQIGWALLEMIHPQMGQ